MTDFETLMKTASAQDVEEVVLGEILLEPDTYLSIAGMLTEESFYHPENKAVFRACHELQREGAPIDLVTVSQKLIKDKLLELAGGAARLSQLTNRVGSSANVEHHARILKEKEITRRQIRLAIEVVNGIQSDQYDPFSMNQQIAELSYKCASTSDLKKERSMSQILIEITDRMKQAAEKDVTGIPSGHTDIDRVIGGWQETDLIILAARPAMGKTALALTWASHIAQQKDLNVAFFSLEMGDTQLITRVISQQAQLSSNKLRTGRLNEGDWKQYHEHLGAVQKMNLTVIDDHFSLHEIIAKARELHMKGEMDILFLDYLQLVEVGGQHRKSSREQDVSMITRSLKMLAKQLKIPIIALSQLSRAVESRGDKRPLLSDLRESGAIEQDADLVTFLYRPEYYKIRELPSGLPSDGVAVFDIAKHRNGSLEEILLKFIGHLTQFRDYSPPAAPSIPETPSDFRVDEDAEIDF